MDCPRSGGPFPATEQAIPPAVPGTEDTPQAGAGGSRADGGEDSAVVCACAKANSHGDALFHPLLAVLVCLHT